MTQADHFSAPSFRPKLIQNVNQLGLRPSSTNRRPDQSVLRFENQRPIKPAESTRRLADFGFHRFAGRALRDRSRPHFVLDTGGLVSLANAQADAMGLFGRLAGSPKWRALSRIVIEHLSVMVTSDISARAVSEPSTLNLLGIGALCASGYAWEQAA